MGVVIGTYASLPYVHLHLESARRYSPGIKYLVHDDHSDDADQIRHLAASYGHVTYVTPYRKNHSVGDLSVFDQGFKWADSLGIDLLVKMSRRFIPIANWSDALQRLAFRSQAATYSGSCHFHGFGFLTECIAMHVPSWKSAGITDEIAEVVARDQFQFVEGYLHDKARAVRARMCCGQYEAYAAQNLPLAGEDAYARWPLLEGGRRNFTNPCRLWHETHTPDDYSRIANCWGLPYVAADFANPNSAGVPWRQRNVPWVMVTSRTLSRSKRFPCHGSLRITPHSR